MASEIREVLVWKNNEQIYVPFDKLNEYPLTINEMSYLLNIEFDGNENNAMVYIKERLNSRPPLEVAELLIIPNNLNITFLYNIVVSIYNKENVDYFMKFLRLNPREIYENWDRCRWKSTPLIQAIQSNNYEVFEQFIELGFDISVVNYKGESIESIIRSQKEIAEKKINKLDNYLNKLSI